TRPMSQLAKDERDGDLSNHGDSTMYGEIVILGYNGSIQHTDRGRRHKSKYTLCKRPSPNGIRKSRHYTVDQPQATRAIQDKELHSISYTISRSKAIIVEYQRDSETDMFQIGRSSESPIDFVVTDTAHHPNHPQHSQSSHSSSSKHQFTNAPPAQSTISRFACRILVDRKPPYTARIYAAGFDSSRNIFLGEKATKWEQNEEIDGLTTNGRQSSSGVWREVSVNGGIYAIRESRSAAQKGTPVENESNILQDGTLIDLCGATLLWRSADGLKSSPTKKMLDDMVDTLNASRPQCPVGLNTLVIPRKPSSADYRDHSSHHRDHGHQPYVYLKCGHVQGLHDWGVTKQSNQRTCPICLSAGNVVRLTMGLEPSFYVDCGPPTHVFNPCGHMANEKTVKYWCNIMIPHGTHFFHSICPFCAVPVSTSEPCYTKLIFQDFVD
ncbi:Protein pellino, partial [Fragariocoptes setiger]